MENTFGKFLKEKRQEKKLTQKKLANILFISESAVSKWEKDVAHPDITLLPELSKILGVSEHELITASIDKKSREEKSQAKKWRALSMSWSLFFYIAYIAALIPCFICNIAINKTLSWFWIVLTALILSFTFTNLPKLIKRHKLILLPLSMYLGLCIFLGTCAIYTKGNWFWIASLSVLLGLIIIFTPIYISKYKAFNKIKNFNDFISIGIDFIALNLLLIAIDNYTISNSFTFTHWYLKFALPIVLIIYIIINILVSIRFLKINKLLKSSLILTLINIFVYICTLFIKVDNPHIQKELDSLNVFKADFSIWSSEILLERNINCIIFLTILTISLSFLISGLIKHFKLKKTNKKHII